MWSIGGHSAFRYRPTAHRGGPSFSSVKKIQGWHWQTSLSLGPWKSRKAGTPHTFKPPCSIIHTPLVHAHRLPGPKQQYPLKTYLNSDAWPHQTWIRTKDWASNLCLNECSMGLKELYLNSLESEILLNENYQVWAHSVIFLNFLFYIDMKHFKYCTSKKSHYWNV